MRLDKIIATAVLDYIAFHGSNEMSFIRKGWKPGDTEQKNYISYKKRSIHTSHHQWLVYM